MSQMEKSSLMEIKLIHERGQSNSIKDKGFRKLSIKT